MFFVVGKLIHDLFLMLPYLWFVVQISVISAEECPNQT